MECTKLNCPMQVGTVTENCGDSCPWRTTVKLDDLILRAAALNAVSTDGGYWICTKRLLDIPAVNAIPVEWLEWRTMNAKYNGIKEAADAFDFVLNCWKEQEAQNE